MATAGQPIGRKVPWYRFPGWWAAVTGGLHGFLTFSIILYGWSVFVAALRKEFGWSVAALGGTVSVLRVVQIPASVAGGWATDKVGPRWTSLVTFVGIGLGLLLIGQVGSIRPPELFGIPSDMLMLYIAYSVVMGFFYNASNYRQSMPAVNRFFNQRRSLAMGIITVGSGLGSTILLPVLALLIESLGWRGAATLVGVVFFLILGTITSLGFVTHPPEHYGLLVDNMTPEEAAQRRATRAVAAPRRGAMEGFSEKEILMSPAFWLIILGISFAVLAAAPLNVFQNLRLQAAGYTMTEAANFFGAMFFVQTLAGRGGIAVFGDRLVARIPIRFVVALCYVGSAVGILAFALAFNALLVWVWVVIYGIAYGAVIPLGAVIMGEYFGRASFGFAYGLRIGLGGVAGFISPVLVGFIRDVSGDWFVAFMVGVIGFVLAALTFIFAAPPKAPAPAAEVQRA